MDYSSNYMRIDTNALERNAKACVKAAEVPVIAVVKMDGCGVGIAAAAKAWQSAGASMFAVSESWEAVALRNAGIAEDILLMAPVAEKVIPSARDMIRETTMTLRVCARST